MLTKLFFNTATKNLAKQLPMVASCRYMNSDLKKEFEEFQKRAKQEKTKEEPSKKDQAKTLEELLKESKEATKEQEEKLKREFQEMKKQKTSLEFGDILKELKEKPKMAFGKFKNMLSAAGTKASALKTKIQAIKKAREAEVPKEEIKVEEKVEERIEIKEEEEEIPQPSKPGIVSKAREKVAGWCLLAGNKVQVKMPRVYDFTAKHGKSFIKLWHETFPNKEDLIRAKMDRVKQMAREQNELEEKMKNMTEEEIKKIQESIPEHMRNALVIKAEEKKHTGGIWSTIAESDAAKKLRETKEYKEFSEVKQGIKDFADILKEELNSNVSPTISGARSIMEKFNTGSEVAEAIVEMRKLDPKFDLFELHDEVLEIFKETYKEFLKGNKEYLEKVCGEVAMALFNAELKRRETEGWEPLMKELLHVGKPDLLVGKKQEKDLPVFIFAMSVQELFCNVSKKDRKVLEGNPGYIKGSQFLITIQRHPNPDLATTGHYWKIKEIAQTGVFKQIV